VSPWEDFSEVKAAYDSIRIGDTDVETVHRLGIDPEKTPNVQILNYSQVAKSVVPAGGTLSETDIPPGIRRCIRAQDHCVGYQLDQERIQRKRVGGFWSDFLNFKRETEITGWRFSALVVMVDSVVVFKQWSGQPHISEVQVSRNPLGPLQGAGEKAGSLIQQ
jgi:hypothetical protein